MEFRDSVVSLACRRTRPKKHHIYLEDASGKKVGSVVALQEPDMLHQQFKTMACVRDIFALMILHHNMNGKDMTVCLSN
jgi:hypothetical protein